MYFKESFYYGILGMMLEINSYIMTCNGAFYATILHVPYVYDLDVCHINVQGIKDCVTSEGRHYICHNAPVEFIETLQLSFSTRAEPAEHQCHAFI